MILRQAARGIVIHNDSLLIMRRRKTDGRQYMVIPGGRLEPNEDPVQTLHRELAEETMISVKNPQLVFIEEPNDKRWGTQYIYLCEYVSGEPQLHLDSEELQANNAGTDFYEPMWFPLDGLPDSDYPFRSTRLGDEILQSAKHGFPNQPKRWTLTPPMVE